MVRQQRATPGTVPVSEAKRLIKPVVSRTVTPQRRKHHTQTWLQVQSRSRLCWPDRVCGRSTRAPGCRRDRRWKGACLVPLAVYFGPEYSLIRPFEVALETCGFLVSSPVRDFGSSCVVGRNASEDRHNAYASEVTVLATQATLDGLAARIERAYRLRRTGWYRGYSTARVWSTAAAILVQLHQEDPTLPLDPELYVAVQPVCGPDAGFDDPWVRLTQAAAVRRYRRRVHEMIRSLRTELRSEVRFAERRISGGETIGKVLLSSHQRLSPLGCYIVAIRAERSDLGERFRLEAVKQHRSCPLYRAASRQLLPPQFYPVRERSADEELVAMTRHLSPQILLN
jgi:hypothetical protein